MIGCPTCGSSSAVQIVADTTGGGDPAAPAPLGQWAATCGSCATAWVFTDEEAPTREHGRGGADE